MPRSREEIKRSGLKHGKRLPMCFELGTDKFVEEQAEHDVLVFGGFDAAGQFGGFEVFIGTIKKGKGQCQPV